jgi:hypothetical protein
MTNTPFEISVTLNATSQMLYEASPPYKNTTAVAPSNQLENVLGFDVELPFLKSIFLQYKRPYLLSYEDKPFSFHTDHPGQLDTLRPLAQALPRTVFYALPLVPDNSSLNKTLKQMIFVDAGCLQENTSRVRIPQNYCSNPYSQKIKAKVKTGDWYTLNQDCCWTWEQFIAGINSPNSGMKPRIEQEHDDMDRCPVGMVLQRRNEPVMYSDTEMPIQTYIRDLVSERDLSFWKSGLTTGMFARE